MKKGQTSFFILLGMIFVAALGFVMFVQSIENNDEQAGSDTGSVKFYIENCLSRVSSEGLAAIGSFGGYSNITRASKVYSGDGYKTAYGFEDSRIYPSLNQVADELAHYVDTHLIRCVDEFKAFKAQGFEVMYKDPESNVVFTDNNVMVKTDFPVTVKKEGVTILPDFSTHLNVRYAVLHDYITEILSGPIPFIDMSYLGDIDLDTFVINDGDTQVYVMIDPKSRLLSEPYMVMFAVK